MLPIISEIFNLFVTNYLKIIYKWQQEQMKYGISLAPVAYNIGVYIVPKSFKHTAL